MINLPKNVLGAFRGRKEMYGKGQDDPFTKGNGGYRACIRQHLENGGREMENFKNSPIVKKLGFNRIILCGVLVHDVHTVQYRRAQLCELLAVSSVH